MVLAQDFMSAETLSLLRDKFSPSFGVNDVSLRPIVAVFNKLKNTLPKDTFRQVVGLLLQYNTSQTTEKLYHHILVENRLLHILREYEGLRFELLDVLHDTTNHADYVLNAVQAKRPVKEPMNRGGVRGGDIETDNMNHMTSSTSDAHEMTGQLKDETDERQSREFGLSRQLYQKIPTSLHHSNVDEFLNASEEEMRDVTLPGDPREEVLLGEHLDAPTEQLGVDNGKSDERETIGTKMASFDRGSSKRKERSRDKYSEEGGGEIIGRGETGVADESCSAGESVVKGRESEMDGRSRKRTRRIGAREDDMMLRKVGSHCIVIGVKEHAMTTDSSDYNTQSETETMGSELMTSQDDDEEGALVIVEEKHSSTKPKKQKKKSRSVKSSASLVKVSALCRGAVLEKCDKRARSKKAKRLKEDGLQVVLKKGIRLPRSQQNVNNSCSASELSDEDVLNSYLEIRSRTECLSPRKMDPCTSDDERTVLDILSCADSEDSRSETQANAVLSLQKEQLTNRKRPYPDKSTSIMPFTSYLGLQPRRSEFGLSLPKQDNSRLLKSDRFKSVYSSTKSRPKSKSARLKYDSNFPLSTAAFSAMSSIAEAASFEGSDCLHSQLESSQDDTPRYSDWDTASSQDSYLEHDRAYGLGTFAQDDADDLSFLNRLLRSPSPPSFIGNDGVMGKKRRHRNKPKKERKPRKPRRSRRIRGKHSREGDVETNENITSNASKAVTGRACTCCS